ncbi:MAG: DUF2852 domain-containing protein [Rhodospirillales bacterium]|nr:DUF2852 domain-containing protein [Rhodospirillales bacterium]QQS13698.1 MAG: DUF2852 domain-containing protein [Rhodospirillales bacterium]
MGLVGKLDDLGKPAWIALMVVAFVLFWPVGLGILIYLKWSGRMSCWKHQRAGHWYRPDESRDARHEGRPDGRHGGFGDWVKRGWDGRRGPESSGNHAFDTYREDTLRRLEEEQREFREFLERLRYAKDKAEFDQFMADRRAAPPASPEGPHAPSAGGPTPTPPAPSAPFSPTI